MKKLIISLIVGFVFVGLSATTVSAKAHKVEKGDTLYSIADTHNTSVKKLKNKNDLTSNTIYPGQKLTVNKKKTATKNKKVASKKAPKKNNKPNGKTISVSSTAYTAKCAGCTGVTATGVNLNKHPKKKVIAVDPDIIPLGSKVHVEGYGDAVAADTGGAINGKKIDVHVPSQKKATSWGNKNVDVTILD